jgi:hypothetical protein
MMFLVSPLFLPTSVPHMFISRDEFVYLCLFYCVDEMDVSSGVVDREQWLSSFKLAFQLAIHSILSLDARLGKCVCH